MQTGNVPADPVGEGKAAWERIKARGKMDREDWRRVGRALREGRRLNNSNKKFGDWCTESGFGDVDRRDRADAMWLDEMWEEVEFVVGDTDINRPTEIRKAYRKRVQEAEAEEALKRAEKVEKLVDRAHSGDEGSEIAQRKLEKEDPDLVKHFEEARKARLAEVPDHVQEIINGLSEYHLKIALHGLLRNNEENVRTFMEMYGRGELSA